MSSTTATSVVGTAERRSLDAVLLARRGAVYVPVSQAAAGIDSAAGVALLEADLLDLGYLLSAPLRDALGRLDREELQRTGSALLADLHRALGSDRPHTPLFREFPASTPHDTFRFYVDRVLSYLLQDPETPCVLCGEYGTVHAVSPCAHLVCRSCFDGADFSACPICHRRIDADDPFLQPARVRSAADPNRALPARLRILAHGGPPADRSEDAGREIATLLARPGALSPQDTDDLTTLLTTRDRNDLRWLPEVIAARETKARVLAWLLEDPAGYPTTLPAIVARIDTATDVLRLLAVRSGGDAGLVEIPRFRSLPRPVRRTLLAALDALEPAQAVQDMGRHRRAWLHAAELLHPFESADRHPDAALAFAALRRTRVGGDALGLGLRATADRSSHATLRESTVHVSNWGSQVETALAADDVATALALLAQRPGELLRRLDHLLRTADDTQHGAVIAALRVAAPRVAPAVLFSTLGAVRTRARKGNGRVVFPKGGATRVHYLDETRRPLAADLVAQVTEVLTREALRRAELAPAVDTALIDAELAGVVAPFAERTASRALVTLPRGSEITLPDSLTLRLFLHWMESAESGRTDLDLSLAMFNDDWVEVGRCDYTSLRFAGSAAVHSGDLTSAPAPQGATEFVDLNLEGLADAGVRYVMAIAFSYNSVPFEELAEAFAGVMVRDRPGQEGPVFDPRSVEQRFDLTSRARAAVPLIVDVYARTLRWLDVVHGVTGTNHSVARHVSELGVLGSALTDLYTSGARVGLGELATWQAAGRARTVIVRHADATTSTYHRRTLEDTYAFAARLGTPDTDPANDQPHPELAYLLRGDIALAPGSETYALHPAALDATKVRLLSATDVTAAFPAS
ncbi:MXAN_6230/SCO0854 family RING domain-containing protein [Streptacidiphilus sp. N1-10]|uniref:MXAN_6230/SCO0854 family RING domain-containing protein n=1 Tax=Streptacidiphilus jeojiensis TaxID=3229225 RepID=A0ABV6XFE9_9ACTN